jgi:undecaprenyl-diphosphatase
MDPFPSAEATISPMPRADDHSPLTLIRRGLSWIGRHELGTILSVLAVCAGVWAFAELADGVRDGELNTLDRRILLALRSPSDLSDPIGPLWLEEMVRDFTALGGIGVLTFLTLAALGFLMLQGKSRVMALLLSAIVGGWMVATALKWSFDRARPDLVPHGSHVYTSSFPSGHAMMSAATYLTIGALLARTQSGFAAKAYFLVLAMLLTGAVGVSRVYLGVHWPTDVLAGWTMGGCWALLCWTIARALQRRGQIEPESPGVQQPDAPPAGT